MSYPDLIFRMIRNQLDVDDNFQNNLKQLFDVLFNSLINGREVNPKYYLTFYQKTLDSVKVKNQNDGWRNQERIKIINRFIGNRNIKNVLDIGAGDGEIIKNLANDLKLNPKNVFAIDFKLPTDQVSEYIPIKYYYGSIPIPESSVDLILMFMVLHHIKNDERLSLIREIHRVLKPNSIIIFREHNFDLTDRESRIKYEIYLNMIHYFWYYFKNENPDPMFLLSKNELIQLMTDNGFIVDHIFEYNNANPQRTYHISFRKV